MTCGACINRIELAVRRLPGVSAVRVDLRHETATVRRLPGLATDSALEKAIAEAGYEADLTAAVVARPDEALGFLECLLRRRG
jgi:copper chaperone CopZ